jgi:hypothetical protein
MTSPQPLFDRIHRAISAVCAVQDDDGAWTDFDVAGMGASGAWVTAAVGLRLAELPPAFRDDAVERAIARATERIASVRWSYNQRTPQDADTTAHAMLLLAETGRAHDGAPDGPPGDAIDQLLGFQTVDGGFSTFAPGARGADFASWSVSHPDVTAVAVRALGRHRARPGVAAALERALVRRAGDRLAGGWPAFWWALDWYTAAAWARAAGELALDWEPPPRPAPGPLRAPLDAAYLLEVALASGWEAIALTVADVLLAAGGDPLWSPVPVLRVTVPHVARPWELAGHLGGRCYADVRGIYSTAIIASVLARHAERFATA